MYASNPYVKKWETKQYLFIYLHIVFCLTIFIQTCHIPYDDQRIESRISVSFSLVFASFFFDFTFPYVLTACSATVKLLAFECTLKEMDTYQNEWSKKKHAIKKNCCDQNDVINEIEWRRWNNNKRWINSKWCAHIFKLWRIMNDNL